ncbi:hypothetical protein GKR59_04600 [Providencia alcalifaciens]|nr:hypothetical protein [Providencia alcalifaciens]
MLICIAMGLFATSVRKMIEAYYPDSHRLTLAMLLCVQVAQPSMAIFIGARDALVVVNQLIIALFAKVRK